MKQREAPCWHQEEAGPHTLKGREAELTHTDLNRQRFKTSGEYKTASGTKHTCTKNKCSQLEKADY